MSGIRRFSVQSMAWQWPSRACPFSDRQLFRRRHRHRPAPERRLSITGRRRARHQAELRPRGGADQSRRSRDLSIDQARAYWAPSFNTLYQGDYRDTPPNSFLSGGQTTIANNQNIVNFDFGSNLPWFGSSYSVGWENYRATTNNAFANFNPAGRLDDDLQLHAAAAARLQHRPHPPVAAGVDQEPRDLRRAAARGGGGDNPARSRTPTGTWCSRSAAWKSSGCRSTWRNARSRRTAPGSRSARWRRSTSCRRKPKSPSAKKRSSSPRPPSPAPRMPCGR